MSTVAPITTVWQQIQDPSLQDQEDKRKRIETFTSLPTAITRAREVIRKARSPDDSEYIGPEGVAHITIHPSADDYSYDNTIAQDPLTNLFITILPGAFTKTAPPQSSRDNIADLNTLGGFFTFDTQTDTLKIDSNVDIAGDLGFEGNIIGIDTDGTNEGGIEVFDGGTNITSSLLYNTQAEEWRIGDDADVQGKLTAQQLDVASGFIGDFFPDGIPDGAVTFVDDSDSSIAGENDFSYDAGNQTLSVPTISLSQGTSISNVKTAADASSNDAVLTENAVIEEKIDVLDQNGSVLSNADEISFTGDVNVAEDTQAAARKVVVDVQSNVSSGQFVQTSGDTMTGDLTLEGSLLFDANSIAIQEFTDSVSDTQNASSGRLATESAVRSAVENARPVGGTAIDITGDATVNHGSTGGAVTETDTNTFVNEIEFDQFGHTVSIGSAQAVTSVQSGGGTEVTSTNGNVVVDTDLVQDVAEKTAGLFAGSFDPSGTVNGFLRRIDEFGNEVYFKDVTTGSVNSVTLIGESVFVAQSDSTSSIIEYRFQDGQKQAEVTFQASDPAPFSIQVTENSLYGVFGDNSVRKYDLDLNKIWEINPTNWILSSVPNPSISVIGEKVYLAGGSTSSGSSNNELVRLTDQGQTVVEDYAVNVIPDPNTDLLDVVANETTAFVTGEDNVLRKIDASTGSEINSVQISANGEGRDLEFDQNGNVIVAHGTPSAGSITIFDDSLAQLDTTQAFSTAALQLEHNGGIIYAGSADGEIKAFDNVLNQQWLNQSFTSGVNIKALRFGESRILSEEKAGSERGVVEYIDTVENRIFDEGDDRYLNSSGGSVAGNVTFQQGVTIGGSLSGINLGVEASDGGTLIKTEAREIDFQDGLTVTDIGQNVISVESTVQGLGRSDLYPGNSLEISSQSPNRVTVGFAGEIRQSTFDGDNSKLVFEIPHGLDDEPESWMVQPTTDDSSSLSHVEADDTNLYAVYDSPPPAGNGNIVLNWLVKKAKANAPVWENIDDLTTTI